MSAADASNVRARLAAGVLVVAAVAALGWCYATLATRRQAAADAAADLSACRASADRIERLRRRPAVAGAREARDADLAQRIERAARSAAFDDGGGSVERIDPEPARRVGETPYREKPTQVRLRRVTLRQLFAFLHALGADDGDATGVAGGPGLRVKSVRLSAPRGEEAGGDRWTAETTLTYLVYDPKAVGATVAPVVGR